MRNTTIIPVLSLLLAGACVTEVDETESSTDHELAVVDDGVTVPPELAFETAVDFDQRSTLGLKTNLPGGAIEAQRYCVDQSYASADRVSCETPFMTCSRPNWDTQLSRNHPVHIFGCGSGTYVWVHSLWNPGTCYFMRRDAFRAC